MKSNNKSSKKKKTIQKKTSRKKKPVIEEAPTFIEPKKRISNRIYPERKCEKPDCPVMFTPTDARQKYCCRQHQIDACNDRRKFKDKDDICLLKALDWNYKVLNKILDSSEYRTEQIIGLRLLDYEKFDLSFYHKKLIHDKSGHEVLVIYDLKLECIDPQRKLFKIHHNKSK